jgi:hypothetical protein
MPHARSFRSRLAAVVAAAALAGCGTASASGDVASAQARDKQGRERRKGPEELWSLYPLNPLAGRQQSSPSPDPSRAVGEPPSDAVASQPITVEQAADRDSEGVPWLLFVAGGAGLVAVGWGLARRRRPALPGAASAAPGPHAAGRSERLDRAGNGAAPGGGPPEVPEVPAAPQRPAAAPVAGAAGPPRAFESGAPDALAAAPTATSEPVDPRAAQHVCVHLHDGRRIEGWKKDSRARDQRVLILDVESVYDPAGNRVGATALDRFLLPPQIERIELLD